MPNLNQWVEEINKLSESQKAELNRAFDVLLGWGFFKEAFYDSGIRQIQDMVLFSEKIKKD